MAKNDTDISAITSAMQVFGQFADDVHVISQSCRKPLALEMQIAVLYMATVMKCCIEDGAEVDSLMKQVGEEITAALVDLQLADSEPSGRA